MNATQRVLWEIFCGKIWFVLVFALSLQPQTRNEPPRRRADPSEVAEEGKIDVSDDDISKVAYL